MGQDENIHAAIAHVVLCCVTGPVLGRWRYGFTQPGMHANLLVHGIIGILHHGGVGGDLAAIYKISMAASRYLPIPCLMADLKRSNDAVSILHLVSGLIPFAIAASGKEDKQLGNLILAGNIAALCYYAFDRDRRWAWYTAGAATVTYLLSPQLIQGVGPKVIYPLGLALMDYCAYRVVFCGDVII